MFVKRPSKPNSKPAAAPVFSGLLIYSRAFGHSAQIFASARSPLESFVPPLLTRLKIWTTTSTVFFTSNFFNVKIDLLNLLNRVQPVDICCQAYG